MAADQFLHLHSEILMEILMKLSCIKSIVRCMSVCKSWYSLIKDPYFIAKHLSHQSSTTNRYLLCASIAKIPKEPYYFSIRYDNTEFLEYYKLEFPPTPGKGIRTHGCCNGLICFSDSNYGFHDGNKSIYIWNPAIRKFRILPKSIQNPNLEVFGFGFHPKINDYKLVKIGFSNRIICAPVEVEVYSLSTNSWKLITNCGPASCFVRPDELTFVNGTVYWKAYRDKNWTTVSFDLINETFREILLPPEVTVKQGSFCVGTLGGDSIVINDRWSELWVYDQCDESWKKVLNIVYGEIGGVLIGFRNNGEALIHTNCSSDNSSGMVAYSLQTKEGKDFGASLNQNPYKVEPFVESLVLLNDGDARRGLTAAGPVLEEAIPTN